MGWLKNMRELGKARKAATDARVELADAEMELQTGLMKARNPSLKENDIDKDRLSRFLVKVVGNHPEQQIPHALAALDDNAWEIRWAAVFNVAGLVGRLHNQTASKNKKTITENVAQRLKSCLNDADGRVRAEAEDAIDRLKKYQ